MAPNGPSGNTRSITEQNSRPKSTSNEENNLDIRSELLELRKELKALQKENQELKKRVGHLEQAREQDNEKVQETVKRTVKEQTKSYAETLKKGLPKGEIAKQVADIHDRKMNIIVRGIKELSSTEPEERKQHDIKEVEKVAKAAGLDDKFGESLLSARRLGKREEGKEYRPLLVRLSSQEMRESAVRTVQQLKHFNDKNGTRFKIDPDMSKEQMASYQKMWEEANSRSKNGMRFYVVGKENPSLRSVKETTN